MPLNKGKFFLVFKGHCNTINRKISLFLPFPYSMYGYVRLSGSPVKPHGAVLTLFLQCSELHAHIAQCQDRNLNLVAVRVVGPAQSRWHGASGMVSFAFR
jgi:hypothetical protein